MIEPNILISAYQTARRDLLALRAPDGHWIGELSSSALSTATAVSALSIFAQRCPDDPRSATCRQMVARSIGWLARCQNPDGGWGDTDKSLSNISTTMLVQAAFRLAQATKEHSGLLERSAAYVKSQDGIVGLRRRYGKDKTFAAPILMNCALAGMVPWRTVSPLPFELACLPFDWLRRLRLPVVSYAVPALVGVGQARYFHRRPRNPLMWAVRALAVRKSLKVLEAMQPASGGFLEAAPLTSFVVMGLASTGRAEHPVVRRGLQFLLSSFRLDGSCPIDTNLATWNTTLAINALAEASGDVGALGCLDWLLSCQHRERHPFTQAAPGGWGWSDLPGAVPDADDTAGALLALAVIRSSGVEAQHPQIDAAALKGVRWLVDLQNADGGWPTFCRGWGALPFDRSAADLTAHAIRALYAWRWIVPDARIETAVERGMAYLSRVQRTDGSWTPLWFGNQHCANDENSVYGTGRVLLAYHDLGLIESEAARRGLQWLVANHSADGGWGGTAGAGATCAGGISSVEETAVAVEALLACGDQPAWRDAAEEGLRWLIAAVEAERHRLSWPIGFYFAKLWYYERLYPLAFTVAALGQSVRRLAQPAEPPSQGTRPP